METKRILTFWRDIEIFFLPNKPEEAKLIKTRLPWEIPFEPNENFTYRHTVYLGTQPKKDVIGIIEKQIDYSPGEKQQF